MRMIKKLKKEVVFSDSNKRDCHIVNSSLVYPDAVWFGLSSPRGQRLHLTQDCLDDLVKGIELIKNGAKKFDGLDHYKSRYTLTQNNGGFHLTVTSEFGKKKVSRANLMSFDLKSAESVYDLLSDFRVGYTI